MTRDQSARLKRHQKVASVLQEHPSELATLPAVQDLATEYLQRLQLLSPALEQKSRRSQGATETKEDSETALLGPLVRHANALLLLYKKEGNLEAARNLHVHRSDYTRLGAPGLASEANTVAKAAQLRQADLAGYGIQPADVQKLAAAVTRFTEAAPAPKTAIEQRKVGGITFRRALKELDDFLKEDLKAGMELLTEEFPQLAARLQEARRVDAPGYGRSAKAQARKAAKKKKKDSSGDGEATPPAAE
jgi:hypothetical protein